MIRSVRSFAVVAALVAASGCHASTQAKFVVPAGSQLIVNGDPVPVQSDGTATMSAFGWGGASYKITRGGKIIRAGKLDTKFRPISIIWPPFGLIYVPKGLDEKHTYDLSKSDGSTAKAE